MESLKKFLVKRSSLIFSFYIVAIVAFSYLSTNDVGKIYNRNYLYITALAGKSLQYIVDIYYNDSLIYQNLRSIKHRINDVDAVYLLLKGKEYLYTEGSSDACLSLFRKCRNAEKEEIFSTDGKVLVCYPLYEELASELLRDTQKAGVFAVLFDREYLSDILKNWFLKNLVLLFLLFGVGTLIVIAILVHISENFRLLESMIRKTEEFLKRETLGQDYREELHKFVKTFSFLEFRRIGELILNLTGRVVELTQKLKEQAIVDVLTGLYNRNYLEQFVDKIVGLAQRQGFPLAVAMIDIDNFKQVNDTYGHKKGDEVLRTLGKIIKTSIRKSDIAIRYGGEEILIIFPNSRKEYAKYVVDRIKKRLKSYDFGIGRPVTFSSGIAGYPEDVDDLSSLHAIIEIADEKL